MGGTEMIVGLDPYAEEDTVLRSDYDTALGELDKANERADEAERLLSEMAHAFHGRDSAAYAAFVISEPSVLDHVGAVA